MVTPYGTYVFSTHVVQGGVMPTLYECCGNTVYLK